ncbi:protein BREAST CANCER SUSCEPTIBILITY 1 homolog isoform X2 [Beta vulgaris subsp. vulgaris]|uniref:protein BREAST CANCER SUSCEPTIBILITY 1 homolog isoform X2 n=1 Tax=Beta vulgaris subsp. vulgaris TaxID=3555 RepID=UPI000901BF2F|nr:protein BREAST CANCER SUSCEPTIBILITY 1 homolog isoform X2 [Beta vulgaris subsp. vulgaris]
MILLYLLPAIMFSASNSCIHKSMKSGSNCPVCKVPYHRREIRPAPHMDNLVNIYKSMEVASGITLFVSQNGPTTRLSDAEKQANGVLDAMRETGGETPENVLCQRTERVGSISKLQPKRTGRNRGKSSFSTNKRVQVPQSPIDESPARQERDGLDQNKERNNLLNKCSTVPSEHPLSTEKETPQLSPFFWLREEAERSSQQTDVEQLTCTPAKAPSFSDLKDSDDDKPLDISAKEEQSKCNADLFDSEMFEWTQRACSPELCSSPFKKQVEDTNNDDRITGQKFETGSRDAAAGNIMMIEQVANVSPHENNSITDNELHNNTYSARKSEDGENECRFPRKSAGRKRKKNQDRCLMDREAGEDHNENEIILGSSKAAGTCKKRHVQSLNAKFMNEVGDRVFAELPAASRIQRVIRREKKLDNVKRKPNSIGHIHKDDSAKKQIKNLAQPDIIKETCTLSNKLFLEEPSEVLERSNSCSTSHKLKKIRRLTSVVDQKNIDGDEYVLSTAAAQAEVFEDDGKSNKDHAGHSLEKEKIHRQEDMPALRKCDAVSIKCAFCHSTELTEDSGEMVHYCEGRPVPADTEGSVIHSHKSCTEWAPNVYFEDNIVVNLEEELTRSRRIKCSLCGVKGAALGCYEKSCRKSFHVPCAKLLRECRWDTEHFVILCPLHASSKLPSELAIPRVRKAKCNLKGKNVCQRSRVAATHITKKNVWNCARSSEKIVLCCSALASVEKEAVSELAKSSGAIVLGSWSPSVTHVIASMNENGAFKRTLKVLMGILEGSWILSIKWVQACMKVKRLVEETPYEITCDIHGVRNGSRLGRLRLLNEQPKLFAGFNFYFTVEFEVSYKGYLQDLVTAAGGTVLHRKPIASTSSTPSTVIVYSIELPINCDIRKKDMILERRRFDAEALAISSGAKLANNSWVLNCIAGHKLQDL